MIELNSPHLRSPAAAGGTIDLPRFRRIVGRSPAGFAPLVDEAAVRCQANLKAIESLRERLKELLYRYEETDRFADAEQCLMLLAHLDEREARGRVLKNAAYELAA